MVKQLFIVVVILSLFGSEVFGQQYYGSDYGRQRPSGPRRQLATIVFSGLGGAILGLSTLSFYGRPQDNLANIALGFAGGVILGTVYVTIRAATSRDYYDENPSPYGTLIEGKTIYSESKLNWAPTVMRDGTSPQNFYGGQVQFQF